MCVDMRRLSINNSDVSVRDLVHERVDTALASPTTLVVDNVCALLDVGCSVSDTLSMIARWHARCAVLVTVVNGAHLADADVGNDYATLSKYCIDAADARLLVEPVGTGFAPDVSARVRLRWDCIHAFCSHVSACS